MGILQSIQFFGENALPHYCLYTLLPLQVVSDVIITGVWATVALLNGLAMRFPLSPCFSESAAAAAAAASPDLQCPLTSHRRLYLLFPLPLLSASFLPDGMAA